MRGQLVCQGLGKTDDRGLGRREGLTVAEPVLPDLLEKLTMLPEPAFFINGTTCLVNRNVPVQLATAKTRFQVSMAMFSTGPPSPGARHVHEHVDPLAEGVHGRRDDADNLLVVGHIGRQPAAVRAKLGANPIQPRPGPDR